MLGASTHGQDIRCVRGRRVCGIVSLLGALLLLGGGLLEVMAAPSLGLQRLGVGVTTVLALGFAGAGSALMLMGSPGYVPGWSKATQRLAIGAWLTLAGLAVSSGMTLMLAVCLCALALGGLLLAGPHPQAGAMLCSDSSGTRLFWRSVPVMLLGLVVLAFVLLGARKLNAKDADLLAGLCFMGAVSVGVTFLFVQAKALHARDLAHNQLLQQCYEQAEWYAAILNSMQEGVIATNRQGQVTFLNHSAAEATGWDVHEALGQACSHILPQQLERRVGPFSNTQRVGAASPHHNATHRSTFTASLMPLRRRSGAGQEGEVVVLRAPPHQAPQLASDQLAHTANDAVRVLNQLPAPVLVVDAGNGELRFANQAAHDLLADQNWQAGAPPKQAHLWAALPYCNNEGRAIAPEERPEQRLLRGEAVAGLRVDWQGASTMRSLAFHGQLVPAIGGQAPLGVLVAHDISELTAAAKELQQVNQAKDEFLRIVCHDLRTPLNAVLGWLELIRIEALEADEYSQAFGVMDRNLRGLGSLIDELLDMSQIVSGKAILQKEILSLPTLLSAIVEAQRPAAVAKAITFAADLDLRLSAVRGDQHRLKQVFRHLIGNAIQFTPEGGQVTVKLSKGDDGHVKVAITDSGTGLAQDFAPFLLQRFRQAHSSAARRFGGLGLGLNVAQELVMLHGGRISAESTGRGSCFVVDLPCEATPASYDSYDSSTEGRVLSTGQQAPNQEGEAGAVDRKGEEAETFNKGQKKADRETPHQA